MTQEQDRVVIFDTTLRDGEQSPGATMTHTEKLEIASLLDEMGVDIIEAGFPIASEGDFAAVSEIAKNSKNSVICGLARAQLPDIDRCWEAVKHAAQPRIHTFIGTSPLHRAIPNLTMDEMAERIDQTVTHARNLCDNVQWSPMDATRTEADYLCRTVEIAIKAGATTINIPDTVGYTAPRESAALIRMLLERVPGADEIIFATHCHNDLGMATANSLAAVEAGARQIECTINGLGERAGNTALEEVVMALKVRNDIMPFQTGVDSTKLMNISRRVAAVSGFPVQFNKAIVGKNAFAHESGIHQDGMLKNAETFEIMRPEDVGLTETNIVMGKHSGRAALRSKLENLGFELGDNQLKDVFVRFKELADRKKEIYEDDLIALMRTTIDPEEDRIKLVSMRVVCGTEGPQQAEMTLEVDGAEHKTSQTGDGPVDASFNCIKALVSHTARLQLYQVHAVTEGTDAQATVSVRLEEDGRIVTGQSADTDTVVASVRAYVHALNRLLVRREKGGTDKREIHYKDVH
ncbi:2-isopropylmalate synthase [Sulfitobacter pseudonitzschiae]|uniref:2-isopropylmalate synthase n=1 Tax=Pseudosulfitobacter pseudonitzschiae TaxID=1402135 RepID=A0A9Q2NMM8_9RHOB|nr:2-isopropylmalate synthase [Pseudosulfitobacter pseudonitzschiae]MBM2293651.1 2-isopropylmalate synthase [Pseudosulfitobacter pseudonitzschiae]MBM2298465.1 2-isopropylmalate synthase [Pseudosulfitobacter pseudonitzschiae]MBM2303379.1 2-isopropylmalate synthase [Pseudosulfitobacter pseudonitzschiae]MBM2313162.1 2-isopropylmalate synthase [Pseudosulfitobacter pseudonitzschiae]MBM2318075.1 2-isopropylmalate synthase [Pseudosulfitobacter pseudonitzschiae]|tara:strand:+ start:4628 stop:6190 length:1563 start_codon:yes stop_codon:yes gene_type:complete